MVYESYYCGFIKIDKNKWDKFCREHSRLERVSEKPTKVVFDMMSEKWEWEGNKLVISTVWAKHYDFEKFLDEVVKILNENQIGYFDWHGEDWSRSAFYLKKDYWEEFVWKKPKAPNWWLEAGNSQKKW